MTVVTVPLDPAACRERVERYWPVVTNGNGCHLWQARIDRDGYPVLRFPGHADRFAHRIALVAHTGFDTAPGMHVDHTCRVRACVNPLHLEEVTPAENTRRAFANRRTSKAAS